MVTRKATWLLELLEQAPDVGAIVEIGSVRNTKEVESDGYSTVYLASWAQRHGRSFFSFDVSAVSVERANGELKKNGLPSLVRQSDGKEALAAFAESISFLYLDSSDEPQDTLDQYLAARGKLLVGAVVVVDDAQQRGEVPFGKATYVRDEWLRLGWEPVIHDTGRMNYRMMMCKVR